MYRKIEPIEYNFLLHKGGVGDLIARLPAVKYSLDHHPHLSINLFIHDYALELVRKALPYSEDRLRIKGLSQIGEFNSDLQGRSPDLNPVTNLAIHLTEHAFFTLVRRQVEPHHMNYIQLDPVDVSHLNLPEKYAVVTTGYTSDTRHWQKESIKGTSDYLVSKGYTPIYLGKRATAAGAGHVIIGEFDVDTSNGIDLIDKTSLLEAHAIMARAKVVVGLDNGLCHLAAMSPVKIVCGYTNVDPRHRQPYRSGEKGFNYHSVLPPKLDCFGCQSNWTFMPGTDFTKCYYSDYKCVTTLTADRFIEVLECVL